MDRIIESLCTKFRAEQTLGALRVDELFESFCAYAILSSLYEDDFDSEEFRLGQRGDLGIDAASLIINGDLLLDSADVQQAVSASRNLDVTFVVIQARSTSSFDAKTITDVGDNLVQLFTSQAVSYPMSPDVEDLRRSIDVVYTDIGKLKKLPTLRVFYATTGRVTADVHLEEKRKAAEARLLDSNYFETVQWQLLGARELRDLYQRASTAVSAEFSMPKKIALPRIPGVQQAFLGVLPASELDSYHY